MKNLKKFEIKKEDLKSIKGGDKSQCGPNEFFYCGGCYKPYEETSKCETEED